MTAYELIRKKRFGGELSDEEVEYIVAGFLTGEVADYQVSAFMMATCFIGMTDRETETLTRAMLASGSVLDLSAISGSKIDKHSTGGVGDKLSLVVAPLAAAVGVKVPMISGRGLGHTGGTLDKLESIPGMKTWLTAPDFARIVSEVGMAIMGQSPDVVPADRKMYALRDVTATIECVPFIVSSILSKKLAAGVDGIVLDVKVGRGAFMKNLEDARDLARHLIRTGRALGLKVAALLTDMHSPIGLSVGNALEVAEAIRVLKGEQPSDVRDLSVELASRMAIAGGAFDDLGLSRREVTKALDDGRALRCFSEFIAAQGGDSAVVDRPEILPRAALTSSVKAEASGFVTGIDALEVGLASVGLGAGRRALGDELDYAAGIEIAAPIGTEVVAGQELARVHGSDGGEISAASRRVALAFKIEKSPPAPASRVIEEMAENTS